jgi:hypothetical protein
MKRLGLALLAVALWVVAARPAMAQGTLRYGLSAGLLMPTGTYNTRDKMGWIAGAGATYWLPGNVGIRGDLSYSQTSRNGATTGNTKIFGGMASVVYALNPASAPARFMLTGGVGLYNVKSTVGSVSGSQSKVGFGGGAAVAFKMGASSTRLVIASRFTSVSTTGSSLTFLPITVGLTFGK